MEAMELQRLQALAAQKMQLQHAEAESLMQPAAAPVAPAGPDTPAPFVRQGDKVGRNDPCPCGSGQKYKQCHGKLS
jgi:preprotein translocase subunit SecA